MANDINIGLEGRRDSYQSESAREDPAASDGDLPGSAETPAPPPETAEPPGQPPTNGPAFAFNRFGVGDIVILGRPDYANENRNPATEEVPNPATASSDAQVTDPAPNGPQPASSSPAPAPTPAGTSAGLTAPSSGGAADHGISAISRVSHDDPIYAEARTYGELFGYSDEMIDKLAALLQSEPQYVFYADAHFWTNMFPDVLIECVDAVKQNPDGSYDVNGAMAVRDDYVANDPRFDTHLETRGGTQSGGSSGGGDEQAGDRSDDFAAMASGNAFNYWVAQAQGRQPLGGTTDPRYWNPNDIRAGVQEHVDRYNDAVANGDHAAQADSLNDLRVFIRAVNPRLSDDAAMARAFAFAGGNVDRTNYTRDENGRIVLVSNGAGDTSDASDDAWLDRINNAPGLTLTPEQLTERLREVDEGLGRDIRVAELQEASLGSGELVPVGGGSNNTRPPVQPVLNGNWDAALNLASDPAGLLAPWQGTREAMSQLSAANAESQIETRRRALVELGVPDVPQGYEERIGSDGRITRDYGRTADVLTSTYERFVEDQRLRATWGDNYRDIRIGNSSMTVQELERRMMQTTQTATDEAYERGRQLIAEGKLPLTGGNYALTLGNFIDSEVRSRLRVLARNEGIPDNAGSQFAAINRNIVGPDGTVVRPDLRLGGGFLIDMTLANKTPYSQQLRNWAGTGPITNVLIVRPNQLGGSYVIPGASIPKPRPRGS